MRARIKIKHGEIVFSSPQARRAFFDRNEGKDAIIDIDDAPTANSRRYFEGALVPAVYYQHPLSGWIDFGDCRDALKLEFLPTYTRDLRGNRTKVARSTTELSKEGFFKLIDVITRWLQENQMEVPEPDDFKAWRDSAPSTEEVYPPLARLKLGYDSAKEASIPPWHRTKKEVQTDVPRV